ncbi:monovalent cation/H+ antiporter complex subunit F [Micrococcus lylae]|uniref:Na(+) H(+) antiporter subunit F n=1 Tax=Micrococcus lylae TaxID=1273 RepID=A0A1R4IBV4_9MICC|nr:MULTISPECIES: monovalent cation/H+ antiporter complex subunit F [Micrococcus]MCT2007633.1 monovalent cation/H+ antiporter complex subunit F [Micrococcus lylae]MCT2071386.1 monovalent cation/H+ antiporter complex subunit F [Micrococcus lylae]PNL18328.1 transporter [Micrococcus sp. FDAARGOS_333]TFI00399.1 transporter [Micrococcus lylae]WIK83239.1 monovalent cation/H+ antiporter complex subunit F [Micrococcus lylae]
MSVDTVITVGVVATIAVLAVAFGLGILRILRSETNAERAVVGDLVYFASIGMLAAAGLVFHSAVVQDVALLAAFLGILATVALSRILTRGER